VRTAEIFTEEQHAGLCYSMREGYAQQAAQAQYNRTLHREAITALD
jgi:hypothetical protein